MSDSDEEMGGFGPTTPARTKNTRSRRGAAGPSTSKPGQKAAAPSTNTRGKGKGKAKAQPEADNEGSDNEIQEVEPPEADEEEDVEIEEQEPPKKRARKNVAEKATTAKQIAQAKGKAKSAASKSNKATTDDDDIQVVGSDAETNAESVLALPNGIPSRPDKELERVKKKLTESQSDIARLKKQLEEVLKVKETEAERLMEAQRVQYDRQLETKDALIQELQSALAKKEPLAASGKTGVLQLLTREAADEEKRQLEKNLRHWKDLATQREEVIQEKVQIEKDLRIELKMEIERGKTLASSKTTPIVKARSGGNVLGPDDPKNTVLVKTYEDLTNFLVINIRQQAYPHFDLDEWILTCFYTHFHGPQDERGQSLNFNLRLTYEVPEDVEQVTSREDLNPCVKFIPLELDKEDPAFVQRLGYLADQFTFPRSQLGLFLNSISKQLGDAREDDEEGEEGGDQPIVVDSE